jgi:hypothetical protein
MMKLVLLLFVLILATALNSLSQCTPPSGGWSEANQPPAGCLVYPNALWNKLLPNAGSGGPTNHLAPNSDSIAQATVTNGLTSISSTGNAGTLMLPMYYGRASDPIYKVNSCGNHARGGAVHDPLNTFWHIPNQAQAAGGQSDEFFSVWDQTTNLILGMYTYAAPAPNKLANCTATTTATACPVTGTMTVSYCSMANYSTDPGYQVGGGQGDSLDNGAWSLVVRNQELMSGTIPHALYLNVRMLSTLGSVFPAGSNSAFQGAGNWPREGALYFFDYTDAQINAMNLPAWQKPIIVAMSHYGGYAGDAGGQAQNGGIYPSRWEAGEAYTTAGISDPLFAWLSGLGLSPHSNGTSATVFNLAMFSGIPLVNGLDVAHHAHIADPCVALGLAGLPGGCAAGTPTSAGAPSAPTGLTAVVQ